VSLLLIFLKINQIIEIEIEPGSDYSGIYRTRVEDLDEKGIVIGMPINKGNLVPLRPNTVVIIWHWDNSASYAYYCKVKERIFEPVPLVSLDWPFQKKKIQRRNFVRVPANLEIEFALVKEDSREETYYKSHIRDLSGGGTQFISKVKFQKGDILKIRLFVPNEIINCKAKVMWVEYEIKDNLERYLIGIKYIDIPEKVRDKIIKYVFTRQRELIKKGVL
jgi:c-di-GMP-binding flagellar brake protein YcgR